MAKPNNLQWPCNICKNYNDAEFVTHDAAALAFWQGHKSNFKGCKYDPRHAAPDMSLNCPYRKYFMKGAVQLVRVSCDYCGETLLEFALDENNRVPLDVNATYICNKCLKNPNNEQLRDLVTDKKIITENEMRELSRYVRKQ